MTSDRVEMVGHYLPAVELSFLTFTLLILSLRLCSRMCVQRKQPRCEDYLACLAFALAMGLSLAHLIGCDWTHTALPEAHHRLALGSPVYAQQNRLWRLEFIQDWLFSAGELFTKISILQFYKGFCDSKKSRLRNAINLSMLFFVAWSLLLAVALTVLCLTHRGSDKAHEHQRASRAIGSALLVMQSLTLVSDLIVFLIPIPLVWKIKATVKKKVGIIALMGLGLIICFASLIRFKIIYDLFFKSDMDVWYCYAYYLSLSLKLDLSIACACLPFCKPIMQYLYRRFVSRKDAEAVRQPLRPQSPFPMLGLRSPYPKAILPLQSARFDGHRALNGQDIWQAGHLRGASDLSSAATLVAEDLHVAAPPTLRYLEGHDEFVDVCLKPARS